MTWIQIWWLDVLKVKEKNYQRKRFERKKRIDPELALIGLRTRPRSASGSSRGRGLNFSMTHALHFCHKTKQVICQKKVQQSFLTWTAKQSVFFSKSVKKSVKRDVRVLRARSSRASHALEKKTSLALCFQPRFRTFVQLFACTLPGKNTDCFAVYFWPKVWTPHPSPIKNSSSSAIFIYTRNRIILHGLPRNRV